jgi:type II secretory pathway pseudopilin PulG
MTATGNTAMRHGKAAKAGESGFALLLIFAMAAAMAVMLYMELPRVAFEAQRNREQLLIERGEQYQRAIQLYFRKFKNYPGSLDALENTNNIRFLRRRYADPLTGKDEWRLIHVGPGGVFTDSITRKPKTDPKKEGIQNTFITEAQSIGSTLADSQHGGGGPPRRASEGGQMQPGNEAGGLPSVAGQQPGAPMPVPGPGQPVDSGDPNQQFAGQPGFQPPAPVSGLPGMPANPYTPGGPAAYAGGPTPYTGGPSSYTGGPTPYTGGPSPYTGGPSPYTGGPTAPPIPGVPNNVNAGGAQPDGTSPYPQPGTDPNQPGGNQAADLIRNLLTRPRAFPGAQQGMGAAGGQQITAGAIAGVASKLEKSSIKIYNERDKYNEWEFIYDFAKDRTGAGRMAGAMGNGDPRLGQQAGGQPVNNGPFTGQPGGPGGQAGIGGQTGFGGQPGFGGVSTPQPSTGSSGGGFGFGSGTGGGFGQQPTPQPGPIPPPPPPPPGQTANPPQ